MFSDGLASVPTGLASPSSFPSTRGSIRLFSVEPMLKPHTRPFGVIFRNKFDTGCFKSHLNFPDGLNCPPNCPAQRCGN
jgi:hypothetical protein